MRVSLGGSERSAGHSIEQEREEEGENLPLVVMCMTMTTLMQVEYVCGCGKIIFALIWSINQDKSWSETEVFRAAHTEQSKERRIFPLYFLLFLFLSLPLSIFAEGKKS